MESQPALLGSSVPWQLGQANPLSCWLAPAYMATLGTSPSPALVFHVSTAPPTPEEILIFTPHYRGLTYSC